MDVAEILDEWLIAHRYDGLCSEDGQCGCLVGNLGPCGNIHSSCKAGVLGRSNPETCATDGTCPWHIVERGHDDQMTQAERSAYLARCAARLASVVEERKAPEKVGGA
jgi:hypothetical protein